MRGFIVKSISALPPPLPQPYLPVFLELKRLNVSEGCYLTNVQIHNVCGRREEEKEREGGGGSGLAVPLSFDIPNKSFVRSSTSFVYLEELSELLSSYARIARYLSFSLSLPRKRAFLAFVDLCTRRPLALPFRSLSLSPLSSRGLLDGGWNLGEERDRFSALYEIFSLRFR